MGATQLVVQEAFEITKWRSGSKDSSLTPRTMVASTPLPGAEMSTLRAPDSRCPAASARVRNLPDGLDDDVDVVLAPVQVPRVGNRGARHLPSIDDQGLPVNPYLSRERAEGAVAAQQTGEAAGVGDVVDGYHLQVLAAGGVAQVCPAHAAESVDSHPDHLLLLTLIDSLCPGS